MSFLTKGNWLKQKKIVFSFFLLLLCAVFFQPNSSKGSGYLKRPKKHKKTTPLFQTSSVKSSSEIVILAEDKVALQKIARRIESLGLQVVKTGQKLPAIVVRNPSGLIPEKTIRKIKKIKGIKSVSPKISYRETETYPNDTNFSEQWYLPNINAPKGWDITTGSASTTIAVVDSGVYWSHPDLTGKIIGIGGYELDLIDGDKYPSDEFGHGTAVAGLIAASTNNNQQLAGVNWQAKILPVRVMNSSGIIPDQIIAAEGIMLAADLGAKIINCSFGGYDYSPEVDLAVQYAFSKGAIVVAASGNDSTDSYCYPAACPNVIAVGATDSSGAVTSYSNYGWYLDVVAPGGDHGNWMRILGNSPSLPLTWGSGTSFSAPLVSGVASLILSSYPNVTPTQTARMILSSAQGTGWQKHSGFGLLDAWKALTSTPPIVEDTYEPNDSFYNAFEISPNQTYSSKITLYNDKEDFYKFRLLGETTVVAHLWNIPTNCDYDMELGGDSIYLSSNNSQNQEEWIKTRLPAGFYLLGIYPADRIGNDGELYSFKVSDEVVKRIYGESRIETSIKLSQAAFPEGSDTIVLATGYDFPDALAAAPLAYAYNAPLLLTKPSYLTDSLIEEIWRLGASKAIIIGGTLAISSNVESELQNLGLGIERISGKNRFETAQKIADKLRVKNGSPQKVIIATGYNYPDALASSSYAARKG